MLYPGVWQTEGTLIGNWTTGSRLYACYFYGANGAWAADIDHNYLNGGDYFYAGPYSWDFGFDVFTNAPSWKPLFIDLDAAHGPAGTWGRTPESTYSTTRLFLTPEPATILLLATGLTSPG